MLRHGIPCAALQVVSECQFIPIVPNVQGSGVKPEKPVVVWLRIMQVFPERKPIYQVGRSTGPKSKSNRFPGGITMRATILSVAAAAALLPVLFGCSTQSSQVARGQAPAANQQPAPVAAGQPASGKYVTAYGDECDPNCFDASGTCRHCRGIGCRNCRPYRVSKNLVYPPQGEMPAIVQYPYYTCKGPDCFFKAN